MSGMTHGEVLAAVGNRQRKNVRLLTKAEACRELGISLSTLDRRIASGKIETRKKPMGQRHRVYVVVEGEDQVDDRACFDTPLAVAEERIRGLQGQMEILYEQLRMEQRHNTMLLEGLRGKSGQAQKQRRRVPWWRFWGRSLQEFSG